MPNVLPVIPRPYEPTVFIVDDDQAVRSALHYTLKSAGLKVELYCNAQEFLTTYDLSKPGCVIIDVRMPGMSGLDLHKSLEDRNILLPAIFLTGHGDVPMAVRAMKQGAFEFLEKPFDNEQLLARIRHAIALDREERYRDSWCRELAQRLAELKPREREVLDRMIAGQKNKIMAAELRVSVSTIEIHRRHIMEKLEAENLSELIRMILYCRTRKGFPQSAMEITNT